MSFLYPAFLIGAIAVAIPIVLHLLRRDVAPEVPFTAVRLLRRTPLEQTRRRRLRDWLLLIARVTALLLLAAAFARPFITDGSDSARVHIVAIDRSYSMGAPGRFAQALTLAKAAVAASGGDQVAVLAFDDRADVVAGPGPAGAARSAIDAIAVGYGTTRYQAVIAKALELSEQRSARLTVVTDLQRGGWEDEPIDVPGTLEIQWQDAGVSAGNAAVVSIRRKAGAIVAAVRNDGARPHSGAARLSSTGREVAAVPFSAAPGATVDVTFAYRAPDDAAIAVEIDDRDGYPADNRRYLAIDRDHRVGVLVVGGDAETSGFYVTRAIQAATGDHEFDVRGVSGAALGRMSAAELAEAGAVVVLSTRSLDRHGREWLTTFVRAGGGLFVGASPDVDPAVLAALWNWTGFSGIEQPAEPVALAATDLRHPIFRPFGPLAVNLGQVHFSRTWRIRGDGWDVAARFTDGLPAVVERREGDGRVVLFASDLDRRWNDFPLHPGFVPFVLETLRHVTMPARATREYTVADVPSGIKPEPGIYPVQDVRKRVAVNVDVREGSTARLTPEEFKAMLRPTDQPDAAPVMRRAQQIEARQNLWQYGLMLMLVALVAESALGRVR
jgi:hypothetical protein